MDDKKVSTLAEAVAIYIPITIEIMIKSGMLDFYVKKHGKAKVEGNIYYAIHVFTEMKMEELEKEIKGYKKRF